jgi:transcriptional regulator with XRE-family HTH domain
MESPIVSDPEPTNPDRKAEILRRLETGESGAQIARELGVTRQYVSLIKQRADREGAEAVLATSGRRGRPKHRPLSPDEAESLHALLAAGRPGATGLAARWPAPEVIAWFKRKHSRPLSVHELRKFCADHGLSLAPTAEALGLEEDEPLPTEWPLPDQDEAETAPAKRRRRSTAFERMNDDVVEQMMRANAEVARRMRESQQAAAASATTPSGPARLGPKLGRNDPCPFDPTKKFKRCCGATGATRCLKSAAAESAE